MVTKDETICIVAVCECGKSVIYKYIKNPNFIVTSGVTHATFNIEWCQDCNSDEPRYLCKVGEFETPGFLDKCEDCAHKFICASSRIEIIYRGAR